MPLYSDDDDSLYPELPPRPGVREGSGGQQGPGRPSGVRQMPEVTYAPPDIPPDWGGDGTDEPTPPRRRTAGREMPAWGEENETPPMPRGGFYGADPFEPDFGAGFTPASGRTSSAGGKGKMICAVLILLSLVLLTACGFMVFRAVQSRRLHREKVVAVYRNTLPQNVFVDNIPVGGLTLEQAAELLKGSGAAETVPVSLTVVLPGGEKRVFTQQQIPVTRNTEAVLNEAMAGDRAGAGGELPAGTTPLEQRYSRVTAIQSRGAYYYTGITYSENDVYRAVETVAAGLDREPKDAEVIFDPSSRAFTFSDEVTGVRLDTADLFGQMIFMLDNGIYTGEIEARVSYETPAVTRAALESVGWGRISGYTTYAYEDANRNANIQLACRAVNGKKVLPGAEFSFNNTTGKRTEEKGYLPAAAIAGGATVDEVGGGVCQVSSTLFNACAMADMEIVERSPHTWPSTYVDKGRDATVNWPNLDFKFRNTLAYPLYITASFENRACTVELYGPLPESGVTIGLETVLISETPPPEEPVMEYNPSLPRGTQNVKKKARTGYEVQTYKVYYYNGYEYDRVLMCDSVYKMIQQVIEYNN